MQKNNPNFVSRKAQVALEFLMLTITGFFILLVITLASTTLSSDKQTEKAYVESIDLGRSIQQEIIISANLENGYERTFTIPEKLYNKNISVTSNSTPINTGYFSISVEGVPIKYFQIPLLNGTLKVGNNTIIKNNDRLYIINE